MFHLPRCIRNNRTWLATALLVTVLSLVTVFAGSASAGQAQAGAQLSDASQFDALVASQIGDSQIVSGDLVVEEGEVLPSNIVLYSGDAKVKDGGRIDGNLVVYSGNIEIEEEGAVAGDVSAFSGDIEIKGFVGGDVASWSGDVELDDTARVEGDISVLSGDIKRDNDAYVGGNVVHGPSFNLKMPSIVPPLGQPLDPDVVINAESSRPGPLARIGDFFLRIMAGFGLAVIFIPLATLITYSRRDYIARVESAIREQSALSFVTGIAANLVLGLITAFLVITICLACLSPFPGFVLLVLNLIGWTAIASLIGQQLGKWLSLDVSPPVLVILGGLTLAAAFVPLYALGGCFRFIASVAGLLIGAFGVGGVIVTWLNQRNGQGTPPAIEGPVDESPAGPIVPSGSTGGQSNPVARVDQQPVGESDEDNVFVVDPSGSVSTEGDPAAAPSVQTGDESIVEDDFTRITGVNGVLDARLKVAGVRTYAQLADTSRETIADIFGWRVEDVMASQIVEQAQVYGGLA